VESEDASDGCPGPPLDDETALAALGESLVSCGLKVEFEHEM
jgi:hypothetical protein